MGSCLERIRLNAGRIGRRVRIMEVCGGHTNIIFKYGIPNLLPGNVSLVSGPGCPVCVASQREIDEVIALCEGGIPVATYGDMMRVPGTESSLERARAGGGRVFGVYSAFDVLRLHEKYGDIVFFGVGFETSAPMSAYLLENNIPVFSAHKLIPPALEALNASESLIDGFINPGHVSTVIGANAYNHIPAPQVIAGFTPELLLHALDLLLGLIADNQRGVVNAYPEAVRPEGNSAARRALGEYFKVQDGVWRGLGLIPESALAPRDESLDARLMHLHLLDGLNSRENPGCRCNDILAGRISPPECPLYKSECTLDNPLGACMVSSEGACRAAYANGVMK
jgi:hydrogenase expression/formation protein HypD